MTREEIHARVHEALMEHAQEEYGGSAEDEQYGIYVELEGQGFDLIKTEIDVATQQTTITWDCLFEVYAAYWRAVACNEDVATALCEVLEKHFTTENVRDPD
jgi:hypothetical protein